MGRMEVLSGGFLTTIQDQGRQQCQHLGLAEAGAMDKHAFYWGNRLLGNAMQSPALEILLGNGSFSFDSPASIALTGAPAAATVNGKPVASWSTAHIQAGSVLSVGMAASGLRLYLSISGGFKAPEFFGSSSTVIREQTGGLHGGRLEKGDVVAYQEHSLLTQPGKTRQRQVPRRYIPDYDAPLTLHFFPGYHYQEFEQNSIKKLLTCRYTVTDDADRMGYRLAGPALKRNSKDILTIGVPCGAIQVPTAGEPIILLNDRQCTGGYPVLGVVSARDIYRLAQRKPGDAVRFALADIDKEQQNLSRFVRFFHQGQHTGPRQFL